MLTDISEGEYPWDHGSDHGSGVNMNRPICTFTVLKDWDELQPPSFAVVEEYWRDFLELDPINAPNIRGHKLLVRLNHALRIQRSPYLQQTRNSVRHAVLAWVNQYARAGDKLWWEVWPSTHTGFIRFKADTFRTELEPKGNEFEGRLLAWTVDDEGYGMFWVDCDKVVFRVLFDTEILESVKGMVGFKLGDMFWYPGGEES